MSFQLLNVKVLTRTRNFIISCYFEESRGEYKTNVLWSPIFRERLSRFQNRDVQKTLIFSARHSQANTRLGEQLY